MDLTLGQVWRWSDQPVRAGGCGYHDGDFSRQGGRDLYTWRVNRILDRSDLGVRLATDGEDAGRLVEVTNDSRPADG